MSTSQLNNVGTEASTGIYLTLWISLCFIDPSLLGFVAEIILFYIWSGGGLNLTRGTGKCILHQGLELRDLAWALLCNVVYHM